MRILITGGTGLIGKKLIEAFLHRHIQIVLYTRDIEKAKRCFPTSFTNLDSVTDSLEEIDFNRLDAVINLAGEAIINKRWTDKQKRKLCDSRWLLTSKLVDKILTATSPPSIFVSGSAIGVYGRQGNRSIDENHQDFYPEFSSTLCQEWESRALGAQSEKTRVCLLRTGIVLDQSGGALAKMLPAFRLGLGGPIGTGEQGMSWIHIDDMVSLVLYLLDHDNICGAVNATAPNSVKNIVFSKTLASTLHRPCFFKVPEFVLKIAMGEMSDLLIYGQHVYPRKLIDAGFKFRYARLGKALQGLLE